MPRPRIYYRYEINGKKLKLVRVSKILDYMEDKTNLNKWIERVGTKEAKKVCKSASAIGSTIHATLQAFFEDPNKYYTKVSKFNKEELNFLRNYDVFLKNYKSFVSEQNVYFYNGKLGFAGVTDNIGWINTNNLYIDKDCTNKLYVEDNFVTVDFKNYRKHKNLEYLVKSFLQLGAYTLAWNYLYPDKVITNSFLVVSSQRQLNMYYLDERKLEFFSNEFITGLQCYITKTTYDWKDLLARTGYSFNEERNYPVYDMKQGYFPLRVWIRDNLVDI